MVSIFPHMDYALSQFVINVLFCNISRIFVINSSQFVVTVDFCNKAIAICNNACRIL